MKLNVFCVLLGASCALAGDCSDPSPIDCMNGYCCQKATPVCINNDAHTCCPSDYPVGCPGQSDTCCPVKYPVCGAKAGSCKAKNSDEIVRGWTATTRGWLKSKPTNTTATATTCKATEYCCPDAKCLTPTSTSCRTTTPRAATARCAPLTKICVKSADCQTPCSGTCCPDAEACLRPPTRASLAVHRTARATRCAARSPISALHRARSAHHPKYTGVICTFSKLMYT